MACACHPSRGGLHRAGDSRAPQGPPTADIAGRSGAASVDQRTGSIQHSPGEAVEVRGSAPVPFECVWRNDLAVSQAGSPGLAPGWAHNWDLTLHPAGSTSTVWNDLNLTWPNGAKQKLSPVLDEQGDPTGDFETPAGVTYLVSGTPAATLGGWDLVTVTWGCDSTKGCETMWRFEPHESGCYAITARAESSGQAVSFTWANDRRLLGAARDDGAPLYTLTYDANDRLSTVVDVTGRVVSYTFATEVDGSLPRLTEVSDLAPVGETPSRWAWRYNYQMVPPMTGVETVVLMREAIRPGPVDGAHVTATFSYQDHGYVVSELQQPTGERRSFWYEDGYTLDTLVGANARYEQHWNTSFDANGEVVTSTWQGGAEYGYGDPAQPQKPTAITDASGAKTTYTYDAQGNVTSVCDPRGILTTFAYEQCSAGFGKLKTQVRGDTVLVSNSYDVAGRLLAKQDALGGITSFTYDDHDNVQSVTDPLGSITTTLYDEHDQLVTRINPLGAIWTYVYDDRGSLTSEMNPLGAQTQYEYDLAGREIARVDALSHRWTVTRGPSGLALSVTDPMGAITTNVYDGQGRVIGTVDALGRETHATFDAFGNQVGEIDALGRGTASLHDDWSKPVGEQDAQGNVTTLVYDDTFQLTAFAGPMGSITTVLHDAAGRGVAEVNILGQITTRVFDEAGRKAAMIDPLGQVTSYHYDIMDRIVAIEDPLGQRTTTVYDGAGRPEATINALGQISTVVYDAAGQVIASINPLGYRTTTVYDLAGRTVSVTNPLGETHATEYDALNRVVAQVDPLGLRTTVFYDATGQPVATMDAAGCLSTTTYDIVGRAVASVDECGNVTQYVYDAGDRRTAVVDPNGHAWRTVYDLDDNVIGQVDPLGAATATNYDALGRPTVEYDARGWATTTTYDALGRTSSQLYVDGSGVSYAYDALGRVAAVTNPTGTTTHTYDALSRMTSVLYPTGKALTYSYDPLSRRVGMVDHDGGLSTYTYDAGGRLVSQVNPFGEVTTYTHDPLGRTETKILGNGAWAEHDYDPAGRPTALHWRNSTGDTLAAYDAAYDAVGNRVAVTELDGTFQYRYDATGQLLAEQRVGANAYLTTYTYDGAGNRVLEERDSGLAVLYTYNDADELLAVDEMLPAATVLRPFESLLAAPYSASANALRLALPTGSTCTLTHASVYLVGGQGDWNGTNCWTLSVDALGADLAPVTHLASGGIVGAGPAVLQIAIAEEAQALDPSVTPYVGVSLQCVGSAPALLAATGTVALLSDDEEPETLAALRSVVQTPLDTDAASLALPLAAGHAFRLEEATVGVTGAAGDWGSANQWLLKVNSGGGLASARVLSSAVLDEAAAQTLTLPGSTRLFNTSLSPLLTLSADARGNAPELLSLQATARLKAWRLANSVTFTYDPNGSVISEVTDEEVLTYAWDPSDRLVGVARDADPVAAYAYDAGGRRVAATTDAGTTNYLWDEQNLLAELDEALDTLAQYTDYPGVWGGLSSVHAGGASAFFAPDLSSNIRLLLTAAQGVEQASLYGAFGVPLAGATASPLGFGGGLGYFDDGLDRLYVRARHYRPGLGAWMSRDPLRGFLGGYGYVGNSPVGWVDPSGWQAEGYEAEGYLNDALNPTGSEPDPDGKHIAERWADAKEAVSSGLATDARALAGTDPWVAGSLTVDGTALAIEGNRGSLRPAILARDEQQARAAAAAKRVADSDKARRRLEQARNVARNRGRRVKTAAGDYARAEREHRLASDALRGSCSAAASEAAEAASKRGLLETILRQLAKLKEALINGSMRIEELLKAFTKLEPLLNLVGAIIAVRDLYVSIRDFKSCQLKGARCTPKVCGAPVVTALVEAITAVPLLFPPVALNPAFSVPLVVGNLVATGTGAVVQWVWSECFS